MRILFSIIINACILFAITYLLSWNSAKGLENWVQLACQSCENYSLEAWKTYIIWWIILWIMNVTIRPLLKILSLPFYLLFFSIIGFVVNAIILKMFDYIVNTLLQFPWISYTINWTVNFIIAVAIFTFLNMIYSLLFSK